MNERTYTKTTELINTTILYHKNLIPESTPSPPIVIEAVSMPNTPTYQVVSVIDE